MLVLYNYFKMKLISESKHLFKTFNIIKHFSEKKLNNNKNIVVHQLLIQNMLYKIIP